jgi:hypothetical protein
MLLLVEFLLVLDNPSIATDFLEGLGCLGGVPPPTALAKHISGELIEGRVPSSLRDSVDSKKRLSII